MKKFFLGILFILSIQGILVIIGLQGYERGWFNDKGNEEILSGSLISSEKKIQLGNISSGNYGIQSGQTKITYNGTKATVIEESKFIFDTSVLNFFWYWDSLSQEGKNLLLLGQSLGLSPQETIINFQYIDGKNIKDLLQGKDNILSVLNGEKEYVSNFIKNKSLTEIKEKRNEIEKRYLNVGKQEITIDICEYYLFCKDRKSEFSYIKSAILSDSILKKSLNKNYKEYGIDPRLFFSIIFIENMRIHTTYKGAFKQFLSYTTPQLSVMTKFSYGMYGTKVNMITRMINENYSGSVYYIENEETLEYLRKTYYFWDKKSYTYKPLSDQKIIDYIVSSKKNQTNIVNAFFKMQIKGWLSIGIDMRKPENVGYLLTLYNIGQFKEPHGNPEHGGANLDFLSKPYNFGSLGEVIFNSFEMIDLKNSI